MIKKHTKYLLITCFFLQTVPSLAMNEDLNEDKVGITYKKVWQVSRKAFRGFKQFAFKGMQYVYNHPGQVFTIALAGQATVSAALKPLGTSVFLEHADSKIAAVQEDLIGGLQESCPSYLGNVFNSDNLPISVEELHSIPSFRGKIIEYVLDENEDFASKLNEMIEASSLDPYANPEEYSKVASTWLEELLPRELIETINLMKSSSGPSALLVKNYPTDLLIPPTPKNGKRPPSLREIDNPLAKGYVSEAAILGVCGLLGGQPTFEEQEKDSTPVHQVIPVDDPKYKQQASSSGSVVEFLPHTENVYHMSPIKFFSLLCLRGDPKASTGVLFYDDLLSHISKKDSKNLYL